LIDRLERQGLAERIASPTDRRLSVTRITRKGLTLVQQMEPIVDAAQAEVVAGLSVRELRELSRLCERIYAPAERGRSR
jgi:DNA-binding MarR family transcriptional regulator